MARPQAPAGTASLHDQRTRRVKRAFAELPGRYLGAAPDFDATFQIRLGDVGRTWEVRTHGSRCEVRPSPLRDPDVVIGTDASTWLALREGRMSGLDAFSQRRLYARGDLDLALGFEGLFRLPGNRDPLLVVTEVETGAGSLSTVVAGAGPEQVICLHGLGSNKASFFETVAALTPDRTVHALDLPGFGSSAKPARAPYDARWFAEAVRGYMDAVPIVRLLRPELALIPHALGAARVREQFWSLFARPECLDPAAADIAADEFLRAYRSRAGRIAFFAAARSIYLDEPDGAEGFWSRLPRLRPPALFVWGDSDSLIPAAFAPNVAEALPA